MRAASRFGDRERAASAVTRAVRVEAVLLVVLLGVTGFLVSRSPRPGAGHGRVGSTGVGAARAGEVRVLAALDPRRTGSNSLLVQVQDAAGEPYDPPAHPMVSLRTEGLDIGEVTMRPVGAGTYRGEVVVPRAGQVGRPGQHPAEPVREPGDDRQGLTVLEGEFHGHGVQEAVDADLREEAVVAGLGDVGVEGRSRTVLGELGGVERVEVHHRAGLGVEAGHVAVGAEVGAEVDRVALGRRARRGAAAHWGRWSVRRRRSR